MSDESNQKTSGLRRELSLLDAAALSIGILGPVGAAALLGVGAAGILGRATPWAFIFALVGVSLVAYGFVRLSRYIAHSGSVYALAGVTLGPRAGFLAGWALFLAYLGIGTGSTVEIGLFAGNFLRGISIDYHGWFVAALVGLAGIAFFAYRQIRLVTRFLIIAEITGAILVTLLSVVVLVRLAVGDVPDHQGITLDFLKLPSGTDIGTIASAAVFGFLAFAGFEAAAVLGEETTSPRTQIPRAIKVAIVVVGSFYLLVFITQTLGYGTDAKGVAAFQASSSPYGYLAHTYVGAVLPDLLNLAAAISLFGIGLACFAAASRVLFALWRDAVGPDTGLAKVSSTTGSPVAAVGVVAVIFAVGIVVLRLLNLAVLDATFYPLTIGTIALLVAYLLATLGAIRYLFLGKTKKAPMWQIIIPLLGGAFVVYTLYKQIVGVSYPYDRFPIAVGIYLLVAVAIMVVAPNIATRVGRGLMDSTTAEVPASTPATDR